MSDWLERTRETIELTSPENNQFSALWSGNKIPVVKKIGVFDYPLFDGQVVQDLGILGNRYPMTIRFTGINNDIIAQNFMTALSERGPWTVIHPILGSKSLQPTTFTPNFDPVESGNITTIETEWIEPVSDAVFQSIPELSNNIESSKEDLNVQAVEQFNSVKQNTTSERIEVKKVSESGISAIVTNLSNVYNQAADIAADVEATLIAIQDTIDQAAIDIESLGGQINAAVQTPALAITNFTTRLTSYTGMISDMFGTLPDTTTPEDKAGIMTTEHFITAAVGAVGTIVTTSDFTTRSEIIGAIESVESLFLVVVAGLETIQENYSLLPIDLQYFSLILTYGNLSLYIAQMIAFLLRSSLSLKIEKRFKLSRSRSPWEIALTEYGGPGDNDSNLDLFLLSNNLSGDEIFLLNVGREVVVYV